MIAAFTATIVLIAMLTYLDKFRKVVLWLAGFAIGLTAITFGGFYLDAHHYFEAGKPAAQSANVFDQFDTPPAATPAADLRKLSDDELRALYAKGQAAIPARAPAAPAPKPEVQVNQQILFEVPASAVAPKPAKIDARQQPATAAPSEAENRGALERRIDTALRRVRADMAAGENPLLLDFYPCKALLEAERVHPRLAAWICSFRADLINRSRFNIVLAAEKAAIEAGCQVGSDCYMRVLNRAMGYRE
jgi:hypothetical protein